nr:galactitol-1-phosphate 5-dehydrogenase [Kineothrix alysoides]
MKAYVLRDIGELRYEEIASPEIKSKEVLVEVRAAGICGSDIPRIYKTGTYSYPLIPGHEFSGTVMEIGAEADHRWKGKRVGVFPLIPCMTCEPCKKGHYELCRKYSYLGSRVDGGFAEYVAVPEQNLIELPDNVSFEAAAMLEPMAVAVHAIRSMQPKVGETVAVCGLGTIGILLTMFLKDMGVNSIMVIGNKDFQQDMLRKHGVLGEYYCDNRTADIHSWIMDKTAGRGVDVFFECVGKNETVCKTIQCAAPGGRVQLVGNPASDISFEKDTYWKILRNQLTIRGSWNSSFSHKTDDDWHYVLERLERHEIFPEEYITQRILFDELEKGLRIMRDKTEEYVKVMVVRP